ncbi:MAG: hypothetical protein WCA35_04515 [Kovacikia sp.]
MNKVASTVLVSLIVSFGLSAIADTNIPLTVLDAPEQIPGQTCSPLAVVDAPGATSIRKSVSQVGFPWLRANWNTDFAMNHRASRYVASIQAKSKGDYKIAVYLKYPNQPADKIFEQNVALDSNDVLVVTGYPRRDQTPNQVNIFVGGALAAGNDYIASAVACDQPDAATEAKPTPAPPTPAPATPAPATPTP